MGGLDATIHFASDLGFDLQLKPRGAPSLLRSIFSSDGPAHSVI